MKILVKTILVIVLYFTIQFSSFAEYNTKFNVVDNALLSIRKYAKENMAKSAQLQSAEELVKLYAKVTSNYNKAEIENLGGIELVKTKSVALIQIPTNKIEALSQLSSIVRMELVKKPKLHLDKALPKANVDKVHQGTDLKSSYTGKGVIVGVGDVGFDFTHAMFSDANDNPRVKRAWLTAVPGGNPPAGMTNGTLYADSNEIKNGLLFSSDADGHGTHVLGIAAGSPVIAKKATYSGIATNADIIVVDVSGEESGANSLKELAKNPPSLLEATSYMFKYADSVNKPIVVNYSLGAVAFINAADGESLIELAISELLQENSKGKIVCVSAGNEGNDNAHAKTELNENDSLGVKCVLENALTSMGTIGYGAMAFWGETDNPFTVNLSYKIGGQEYPIIETFNTANTKFIDTLITVGGKYLLFSIAISPEYYETNRPSFHFMCRNMMTGQKIDTCIIRIKGYNTTINSWTVEGKSLPLTSNYVTDSYTTISIPATIEEVISVGAYISRTGGPYHAEYSGKLDDIANFSSKGPLTNGKIKPDITAPGAELVSAKNSFFSGYDDYLFDATSDNKNKFISIGGTSMSSPFVAGVVALMLEKKPDLTSTEIKEIFKATAINDDFTGNCRDNKSVVWGYGKIDAYSIMKYLEETSIDENMNMYLSVFPNPATEYVNVIFDNPQNGNIKIDILNSIGQIISTPSNEYYNEGIQSFSVNISSMNLTTGTYFVRMATNNISQVKNFIVK
jgi:subtilisin family serine protease